MKRGALQFEVPPVFHCMDAAGKVLETYRSLLNE